MRLLSTWALAFVVSLGVEAGAAVPSAPAAPSAVEGNTRALVSWTPPAPGGSSLIDYQVQAFLNGSTTPSLTRSGITTTTYQFTGLLNGGRYRFRVRARNVDGFGGLSAASSTVTPTLYGSVDGPGLRYVGAPVFQAGQVNHLAELEQRTNAVGLFYTPTDLRVFDEAVRRASPTFRLIVFLNAIVRSPTEAPLPNSTITANLTALRTRLGARASSVLAFALDEPVWRAHLASCTARGVPSSECLTAARTTSMHGAVALESENVARLVRSVFPGARVGVVESGVVLNPGMTLPRTLDLYGFDCYPGTPESCYGASASWMNTTLRDQVVALNAADGGSRRLLHIPQASVLVDAHSGDFYVGTTRAKYPADPGALAFGKALAAGEALRVVDFLYGLAKPDPLAFVFSFWLHETLPEGPSVWVGARTLPYVNARIGQIAQEISGKVPPVFAGPPVVEFLVTRGRVGGRILYQWSAPGAEFCVSVSEPGLGRFPAADWLSSPVLSAPQNGTYTIRCTNGAGSTDATRAVIVDP